MAGDGGTSSPFVTMTSVHSALCGDCATGPLQPARDIGTCVYRHRVQEEAKAQTAEITFARKLPETCFWNGCALLPALGS